MNREINTATGDYTDSNIKTLKNSVYIRLNTPLGSWWADKNLGSLLHTLQREKDVSRIGLLAQQYAEEALQPLISSGRASEIIVDYQQNKNGLLILLINVTDSNNNTFQLQHEIKII
ncbi:hypothetical protein CEP49_06805 [Mergibacter septicus]|uniref:phage GP46 family protein n=1 Tax=Mergibacter septicus TaxID=221402 RepID=UPI001178EAAD|nr:phage GP46 family protein [Mergibacter septicus]AWX14278.1 hypothetical protein CEP49_06805 [Mergibacter septicus]